MLLPTMTLDELYRAVQNDRQFIDRKLDESVKACGRVALKSQIFPLSRKYTYTHPKSKIEYSYYIQCYKRSSWRNPKCVTMASYSHSEGITTFNIGLGDNTMIVITSHFWQRFHERYIKNDAYTIQDTIDFFARNMGVVNLVNGVVRSDERYFIDDDTTFIAGVCPLGVLYCEQYKSNPNIIVLNTYLSLEMLRKQQNNKIAMQYLAAYVDDYKDRRLADAASLENESTELDARAMMEHWSMDQWITESEKLMDKYPLFAI